MDISERFDPDKISIQLIRLIEEKINGQDGFGSHSHELSIVNKFTFGFNPSTKVVKVDFYFKVNPVIDKNVGELIIEARYNIYYLISNLEELMILREDGNEMLHPVLTDTLAQITYSTVRGLTYSKLKDTQFDNFLLPVMSVNKLMARVPGDI